jgi:signal transduction histidine kinase
MKTREYGLSLPTFELERAIELSELELDYEDTHKYLSDLTQLAALVAGTPFSLVNLLEIHTKWTVSNHGIVQDHMPRDISICQHVVHSNQELEVPNLSEDPRFMDRPFVMGEAGLRYYYGVPLLSLKRDLPIGVLCVLDNKPRELDPEKKELIKMISAQIVKRLIFVHEINRLQYEISIIKDTHHKVSHDIKGPLTGIIGIADLLEEHLRPDQTLDVLELVTLIKKSGESVIKLAEEIMNLSFKSDNFSSTSGKSLLEKLKSLYKPQAMRKYIQFEAKCDDFELEVPLTKIIQIVGNLISNAIKFTPLNGRVLAEAYVEYKDHSNNLILRVHDSGQGMPPSIIKEILEGNAISSNGTSGEEEYGFGLRLVNHLVTTSGGTMHIDSSIGAGTVFEIKLPV